MRVDEIVTAAMELPGEPLNELLDRLNARRAALGGALARIEEAERRMDLSVRA